MSITEISRVSFYYFFQKKNKKICFFINFEIFQTKKLHNITLIFFSFSLIIFTIYEIKTQI
jgi:hypothetical protein